MVGLDLPLHKMRSVSLLGQQDQVAPEDPGQKVGQGHGHTLDLGQGHEEDIPGGGGLIPGIILY